MDSVFYAFAVLLFAAVILLVEGAYLWWRVPTAAARAASRAACASCPTARAAAPSAISILKQRRYSQSDCAGPAAAPAARWRARIDSLLKQAGVKWSVAQFVRLERRPAGAPACCWRSLAGCRCRCALLIALLSWASRTACCAGRAACACSRSSSSCRRRPISWRAPCAPATPSTTCCRWSAPNCPSRSAANSASRTKRSITACRCTKRCTNLAARIPLTDLRYLVIAVLIQREAGGNLAEILGNISHIIRERLKLVAQVRVLSAEGRMSAWVLGLLPFGVMLVMVLTSPTYISMLWTDPTGVRLLWYGAGMLLLGVLWLRKLIHIRI